MDVNKLITPYIQFGQPDYSKFHLFAMILYKMPISQYIFNMSHFVTSFACLVVLGEFKFQVLYNFTQHPWQLVDISSHN